CSRDPSNYLARFDVW
nr:immunoglobulin heavy chain junction region [Macaca mulatta]